MVRTQMEEQYLICCLPFCPRDAVAASRLLSWIIDLGGCQNHTCLLVADAAVPWHTAVNILGLANKAFRSTQIISTDRPFEGQWPKPQNAMFLFAADYIQVHIREPWLWLEPDSTPLAPHWLETIDAEYYAATKPFWGTVYRFDVPGAPFAPMDVLSGIAVYPADASTRLKATITARMDIAWDVTTANLTVPEAHDTNLLHWLWGEHGNPPRFAEVNVPGTSTFCLKQLKPGAVLFHRNKDGTLIQLLRRKCGKGLMVAMSYCLKDADLALQNMEWMARLSGKQPFDLVFSHDQTVRNANSQIEEAARRAFQSVTMLKFHIRQAGWPQAPNMVFQLTARHMESLGRPWLWLEPDAWATKPNWLTTLQSEYARADKPFMGPIVPIANHMNGVGIYPPDTPSLIPKAMRSVHSAWDSEMREEMIHLCHDAGRLIQHCWGIVNNCAHPHAGEVAFFRTAADVKKWLLPTAVLFHRCKSGSLADRLSERTAVPAFA